MGEHVSVAQTTEFELRNLQADVRRLQDDVDTLCSTLALNTDLFITC